MMRNTTETLAHAEAWELIPWWVNGRLSPRQRPALEAHLRTCGQCSAEVRIQQSLQNAILDETYVDYVPATSLQKLWKRIDAPAAERGERIRPTLRWLAAAVVLQGLGLAWIGTVQWQRTAETSPAADAAMYRTFTTPPPAADGAVIRAVFSPALTLGELQNLLAQANLKVVAGPTEAAVYSLAAVAASPDPHWIQDALARLRAHPGVRFAEPIVESKAAKP